MRVVIDTNVLVSALLSPGSAPGLVLETVLKDTDCQLLLSPDLLTEYEEVLTRKKFSKAFKKDDVMILLATMAKESVFLIPFTVATDCEDADDNMMLALAMDGFADCMISGDQHLLKLHPFKTIPILDPSDFLKWLKSKNR